MSMFLLSVPLHKNSCNNAFFHPQEQQLELRQRMGQALRHAGVAITVTSMTDCAAFLIGSTTVSLHKAPSPPSNNIMEG